jgi:hypothetical protein
MNEQPKAFREGFVEAAQPDEPPPVEQPVEEPAAEEEALFEEKWPIKVKLVHKPLRNKRNEFVHELEFREPTGGDINRYGNPVRVKADGGFDIDEKKMSAMMASLAGILTPHFEAIDTRDWNSCAYRLAPFFVPEPGLAWV